MSTLPDPSAQGPGEAIQERLVGAPPWLGNGEQGVGLRALGRQLRALRSWVMWTQRNPPCRNPALLGCPVSSTFRDTFRKLNPRAGERHVLILHRSSRGSEKELMAGCAGGPPPTPAPAPLAL